MFAAALCAAAALVLGSNVELTGVPSARLAARLDRGAGLYAAGVVKHGFDEALVMRDYLVRAGVPAASIIVDSGGADTDRHRRPMKRGEPGGQSISMTVHLPSTPAC